MLPSNKANISLSVAGLLWPCILPQVRANIVCLLLGSCVARRRPDKKGAGAAAQDKEVEEFFTKEKYPFGSFFKISNQKCHFKNRSGLA
jgi:hypothetical protein